MNNDYLFIIQYSAKKGVKLNSILTAEVIHLNVQLTGLVALSVFYTVMIQV